MLSLCFSLKSLTEKSTHLIIWMMGRRKKTKEKKTNKSKISPIVVLYLKSTTDCAWSPHSDGASCTQAVRCPRLTRIHVCYTGTVLEKVKQSSNFKKIKNKIAGQSESVKSWCKGVAGPLRSAESLRLIWPEHKPQRDSNNWQKCLDSTIK